MTFFKTVSLFVLLSFIISCSGTAQNSSPAKKFEFLEGLTKMNDEETPQGKLSLDGESIPLYNTMGKRVRGMEMVQTLTSGVDLEIYKDDAGEIKAIILIPSEDKTNLKSQPSEIRNSSHEIGKKAMDFSTTDMKGNSISLESLKGKVVVYNFWFVQCKPCIVEMPELNKLVEKYKDQEVVFLAFALNEKTEIESFLTEKTFNYTILPSALRIAKKYNVVSYPTHIILDRDLNVVYSTSGLSNNTISEIENTIEELVP